jgi:hypothetical protein
MREALTAHVRGTTTAALRSLLPQAIVPFRVAWYEQLKARRCWRCAAR